MFVGLLSPALTTLRVPEYGIGASAAGMLLGRIGDRRGEDGILFQPELVVRASAPRMGGSKPPRGENG